jgi:site-specific recombinase XerD
MLGSRDPAPGQPEQESAAGINGPRLWAVMKRFFALAADAIAGEHPATVDKLCRASPHWMRHKHALQRGVELTTVRDNLRHASLATTSIYLHTDEARRASQLG